MAKIIQTKNNLKKINWLYCLKKLELHQKLILKKHSRKARRNAKRLLLKSFAIRLCLLMNRLCLTLSPTNIFSHKSIQFKHSRLYFKKILEYTTLKLKLHNLSSSSYCKNLVYKINQITWLLCLVPLQEQLYGSNIWECRLCSPTKFLNNFYSKLKIHNIHGIFQLNFNFLFTKKLKIWLMKYLGIEKKFLFMLFLRFQKSILIQDQLILRRMYTISLMLSLKNFYMCFLIKFIRINIKRFGIPQNYSQIIYYSNTFLIQSGTLKSYSQTTLHYLISAIQFTTFSCSSNWNYNPLTNGLKIFGFLVQNKNGNIKRYIHPVTIKSHQREMKIFIKNCGRLHLDQMIYLLNKKMYSWKNYYLLENKSIYLRKKLNSYLFWRIWYFLKKKYKNRGNQWLISKYFLNPNKTNWIFISTNFFLYNYN